MDGFTLRCNNIRCRAVLELRAVVTTCYHVFCEDCSQSLQLVNPPPGFSRQCPACEAFLNAPDDACVTSLNPTEDYKTSVLSGFQPSVILEICQRALAFWNYQVTQEVVYQETMARGLTDKYQILSTQLDKVIHDANIEVARLQDKVAMLSAGEQDLRKKNYELMEAWRDKGRKLAQTQELYDKLKRRTLMSQVGQGAAENLERVLGGQPIIHDLTGSDPITRPMQLNHQQSSIRRQKVTREPEFMMTGARVGNVNGGTRPLERSRSSSSGRRSPALSFGGGSTFNQGQQQNNPLYNGPGNLMPTPSASQEHRQRLPPTPNHPRPGAIFVQNNTRMSRVPLNPINTSTSRVSGGAGFAFRKS
ncbi:hypothetical protein FN846DRAFT_647217 [Sphaerosporella brunnea]|uniref:RING-type domain-containing protein n=1 Tax=Sphaerosporella brunnea TaxID=1250544 RepID=A0A5J5F080_9PEZI|nr:hypothetical protein FN846DRAFT_647217 [Sphaerosporella brunnea]